MEIGGYELREPGIPYNSDFDPENRALSEENTHFGDESVEIPG